MEQLTKVITIRLTADEYQLLNQCAMDQQRTIAWIAREKIRKGLATAN